MASLEPIKDTCEMPCGVHCAAVSREDHQDRELLKIKVNAAIAAAPVALTIGWGVMHGAGYIGPPENWLTELVAPIISTAMVNLASSYLSFRQWQRQQAQREKF